jgi:hypothetical protein
VGLARSRPTHLSVTPSRHPSQQRQQRRQLHLGLRELRGGIGVAHDTNTCLAAGDPPAEQGDAGLAVPCGISPADVELLQSEIARSCGTGTQRANHVLGYLQLGDLLDDGVDPSTWASGDASSGSGPLQSTACSRTSPHRRRA